MTFLFIPNDILKYLSDGFFPIHDNCIGSLDLSPNLATNIKPI